MAKISSFIISMLLVSLGVTVLFSFYSGVATSYTTAIDSGTEANITAYDEFDNLKGTIDSINQTVFDEAESTSGVTDLIGKFLGSGFDVLRVSAQSFSSFYNIVVNTINIFGLPRIFLDILIAIAIVIFTFIVISVLVGKDV